MSIEIWKYAHTRREIKSELRIHTTFINTTTYILSLSLIHTDTHAHAHIHTNTQTHVVVSECSVYISIVDQYPLYSYGARRSVFLHQTVLILTTYILVTVYLVSTNSFSFLYIYRYAFINNVDKEAAINISVILSRLSRS